MVMAKLTYRILPHDGAWAYRVGDTWSERFATHDLARGAAERAAREQSAAGETTVISYEDAGGEWHREISPGDDRPATDVEG
jgi:hypothetical protein